MHGLGETDDWDSSFGLLNLLFSFFQPHKNEVFFERSKMLFRQRPAGKKPKQISIKHKGSNFLQLMMRWAVVSSGIAQKN